MIFDSWGKSRKEPTRQQMVLGQLGLHRQKNEVGPLTLPAANINSKWIKVLGALTVRHLEENR